MKTIYQYSCPGTNVGDNALTIGLLNSFKKYDVKIKTIRLRGCVFTPEYIKKINTEADMIIIGGGGLLHCSNAIRKKKKNSSGTLWEINKRNIQLIKVPIIIYAVGYNVFRGEPDLPVMAREAIKEMIKVAKIFTVRNDGSKERLIKLIKGDENKIIRIPDSGLYVDITDPIREIDTRIKNIAIQLAFDRPNYRYKNVKNFIKGIHEVLDYNYNRPIQFWLVPHVKLDDQNIKRYFSKKAKIPYMPNYTACRSIMGFYKKMEVVVGMRGHANICSFGLGVPTISLVSHAKNKGFMVDVGLNNYCVDVNNEKMSEVLIEKIMLALNNNMAIRKKITSKVKLLTKETEAINKEIMSYLNE